MTQQLINHCNRLYINGEFRLIQYIPEKKVIICDVNETVTLVLKRTNAGVTVMIKNASKYVTLTEEVLKFICDSHVSIGYLCSFLEKQ